MRFSNFTYWGFIKPIKNTNVKMIKAPYHNKPANTPKPCDTLLSKADHDSSPIQVFKNKPSQILKESFDIMGKTIDPANK